MQSLWMALGALMFSLSGLMVKFAAEHANAAMIVFFRGAVGALALTLWAAATRRSLATTHIRLHAQRNGFGVSALVMFTYAITVLPLATATTLNYTAPLWVAAVVFFSSAHLSQRIGGTGLLICIAVGFTGIVLLLRPTLSEGMAVPALIGLASGVLSAVAYMQIRSLGQTGEPEWRIVFYHALTTVLVGLAGMALFGARHTTAAGYVWLLANGAFATCGQLCLTRAFSQGRTLLTSTLQYLVVAFAALWGFLFAGELLDPVALAGMAMILAAGVGATILTIRSNPQKETVNVSDTD
jgi:S-adenosylmethionine uptake transporter